MLYGEVNAAQHGKLHTSAHLSLCLFGHKQETADSGCRIRRVADHRKREVTERVVDGDRNPTVAHAWHLRHIAIGMAPGSGQTWIELPR